MIKRNIEEAIYLLIFLEFSYLLTPWLWVVYKGEGEGAENALGISQIGHWLRMSPVKNIPENISKTKKWTTQWWCLSKIFVKITFVGLQMFLVKNISKITRLLWMSLVKYTHGLHSWRSENRRSKESIHP